MKSRALHAKRVKVLVVSQFFSIFAHKIIHTMKFIYTLILAMAFCTCSYAATPVNEKYLKGAVPETNGIVIFSKSFEVPGKSAGEIYALLREYTDTQLVHGPESGSQSRITQDTPEESILAASVEETLWFLRRPMRSDFATMFYQLVFEVKDGGYTATMRAVRYLYNFTAKEDDFTPMRAEEWITDKVALNRTGDKLTRVCSKFRIGTIDRKNAIFNGAAEAAGAAKHTRTITITEY